MFTGRRVTPSIVAYTYRTVRHMLKLSVRALSPCVCVMSHSSAPRGTACFLTTQHSKAGPSGCRRASVCQQQHAMSRLQLQRSLGLEPRPASTVPLHSILPANRRQRMASTGYRDSTTAAVKPHSRARRKLDVHALPVELLLSPAVPQVCFSQACQDNADRTFLIALTIPIVLAAAIAYILRPPPQQLKDSGVVFEDESTGFVFQMPEDGAAPERDKDGLLAFRPISYTPWPVPSNFEGERLRIDVGPIAERKARTFVFKKALPQPSELLLVTLPRPMGVVFEYNQQKKRAVLSDVIEGSAAEQKQKVAGLNPGLAKQSVQNGDVLRGCTCTNFVYPTKALFGAVPPERHVVVYGADQQSWASVRGGTTERRGQGWTSDIGAGEEGIQWVTYFENSTHVRNAKLK